MNTRLISLEQAKLHLKITHNDADYDIEAKLEEASAIVMNHAKLESVPAEWFNGSPLEIDPPAEFRTWTKLVLSSLYWNRESEVSNPLPENIARLIKRDPTIA